LTSIDVGRARHSRRARHKSVSSFTRARPVQANTTYRQHVLRGAARPLNVAVGSYGSKLVVVQLGCFRYSAGRTLLFDGGQATSGYHQRPAHKRHQDDLSPHRTIAQTRQPGSVLNFRARPTPVPCTCRGTLHETAHRLGDGRRPALISDSNLRLFRLSERQRLHAGCYVRATFRPSVPAWAPRRTQPLSTALLLLVPQPAQT